MPNHYVVIGGGLAGISAALDLVDAGHAVTLVDARARLGGAAFSFRRGQLHVDNGQHVFLRCCSAYRGLLERIGATAQTSMQDRLDIPVLSRSRHPGRLARTPGLPAPVHLAASLARYRVLSMADRARAGRALAGLLRLDPADPALDTRSFGRFLREHGQSDAAIAGLWGIIGTATLNAHPDDASLALAAKVFRTGLLEHADAADIGYAAVPLGYLHDVAARRALGAAGVDVLLRHRAREVRPDRVELQTPDGERTLHADGVVVAVPPEAMPPVPGLRDTGWSRLGAAPIVNVHIVYDRRVTELPFAAAVGSPVHWLFDRTDASGLGDRASGQQYLAITVSAADELIDRPSKEVVTLYTAELERLLPAARTAAVLDAFVTRERRATFRQAPGTAAYRSGPDSGIPGLAIAGAWTDTGWPDTMESAVRSGQAAAARLLATRTPDNLAVAP
ncbi:MAG: hydroxysqualene dehydroxylase HpnE [Jatrophihabitans sp.]